MIRGSNADTKNSKLAIDSDAPGANPFLDLATRRKTSSRKRLLKPLAFLSVLATSVNVTLCRLWTPIRWPPVIPGPFFPAPYRPRTIRGGL
jgi:hypothetical protein